MISRLLYNIFILLYPLGARLLSIFNVKAAKWIEGRKDLLNKLEVQLQPIAQQKKIWVHCASLGEFEQGRPVVEALKQQYPQHAIVLSFFSPSGYEVRKNYNGVEVVTYLPMDSKENAQKFISLINPQLIIFIKYEFWFYYLNEAKRKQIPVLLVSGIFRKSQAFFKWYGGFNRKMLQSFNHFFVQNEASKLLLESIGLNNVTVSGDTRFDRVIKLAEEPFSNDLIETFISKTITIVAGSTWTDDDEELDHYANIHPEIKFIIAPHEIDKERIDECLKLYKNSVTLSHLKNNNTAGKGKNVLIIDNVGMLGYLYRYATITLIGGGFGNGIHNTLEAAVYGKPIVFGDEYEKFAEAVDLVENDAAFSVENALELEELLNELLSDAAMLQHAIKASKQYVYNNAGATEKVMEYTSVLLSTVNR